MMNPMNGAEIETIRFVSEQPEDAPYPVNAMRIDLSNGEYIYVPNGGWTTNNPALCVQAFLGVTPSTLHDAEGTFLPYVTAADGRLGIPQFVVTQGRDILEQAEWFVPESTDDEQIDLQDGGAVSME